MKTVELSTALAPAMLPMVVNFAEQAGKAFGLSQPKQLKLAQAVEELFSFFAAQDQDDSTVRLLCRSGGYYVELDCIFPMSVLPVAAFNIAPNMQTDSIASLEEMGLLLAARAVDRLDVVRKTRESLEVRLIVEKDYPAGITALEPLDAGERYIVQPATGIEELKQFAQRVSDVYGAGAPAFFKFPGKVVNMVGSGEYDAALAIDDRGNVGGGIFWRQTGKMAEFYGPYLFAQQAGLAQAALDQALVKLAHTEAVCMVTLQPTSDIPGDYFERLGELVFKEPNNRQTRYKALYRQLGEDSGAVVYVNPVIHSFVKDCYDRLTLPRSIILSDCAGENLAEQSTFSVALDWHLHQAFLSKLAVGQDAQVNLAKHVEILRTEGILNIFFRLDAGRVEEAVLAPALLASGFVPRLILPWGGYGDVILFQHGQEN